MTRKWLLYLGAAALGTLLLYGSLAALVHQGLSPLGALLMLVAIVGGGIALLFAVRH